MKLSHAVGTRVHKLLNEKDISQYMIAKKTCLTQNCLSNLLRHKTKDVKLSTIYLICEELNISLEEFFSNNIFKSGLEI